MKKQESFIEKYNIPIKSYGDSDGVIKKGLLNTEQSIEEQLKQQEENEQHRRWGLRRNENMQAINELALGKGYYYLRYDLVADIDYSIGFRFLYLCTFADKEGYILFDKSYINEHELNLIFSGLHQNTISLLKRQLIDNNLITITSYRVKVNENIFMKFYLKKCFYNRSTMVFNNGIRNLYVNSLPKEHKDIGKIIPLLPYMHNQYNVLCNEVNESDRTKIKPLTPTEVCDILGYYKTNLTRLKKNLVSITVGDTPLLMNVCHAHLDGFVVNPKVFYKSTDKDIIEKIKNFNAIDYYDLKNK